MGDRYKTLFIGILLISASSWMVMEFGPRACGQKTQEPDGQLENFARDACRAFVSSDDAGFGELLVRDGDITADERYGWFPFSGAAATDFEPWAQTAKKAALQARKQLGDERWTCGKITGVDRLSGVRDMQGRVSKITIEISNGARTELIELGPSVRAKRGRVFQGDEDGVFIRRAESAAL